MNDSTEEMSELIEAGRQEVSLDPARRLANRGRLLARVGAGVAVASTTASASAAAVAAKSSVLVLVTKIAAGAVIVTTAGLGARAWVQHVSSPAEGPRAAASAAPLAEAPVPIVTAPSSEPSASSTPVAPRSAAPTLVARMAEPTLESDMQLLRDVDAALRAGHADAALQMLDHRRSYGSAGALVQERAAARVVALSVIGRTGEARAAASSFLERWPDSPLASRVRAATDTVVASPPLPSSQVRREP